MQRNEDPACIEYGRGVKKEIQDNEQQNIIGAKGSNDFEQGMSQGSLFNQDINGNNTKPKEEQGDYDPLLGRRGVKLIEPKTEYLAYTAYLIWCNRKINANDLFVASPASNLFRRENKANGAML